MAKKPLNGELTHPLKPASISVLREIAAEPKRRWQINPGVVDRLLRGGLIESEWRPDKRLKYAAREIEFFRITDAGRAALTAQS